MIEFFQSETFYLINTGVTLILLICFVISCVRLKKLNKNYNLFMKKLGKGENIEEILKKHIAKVELVENENKDLLKYCQRLDKSLTECIQKVGIIRYNAFKDTGSDLSFALALLNENNDGVILNGIYSREMSNIYAKQVTNGNTSAQMSEEEKQALNMAINQISK